MFNASLARHVACKFHAAPSFCPFIKQKHSQFMKKNPKPGSYTLLFIMKITLIHMLLTSVTIVCASALDSSGQGVLERKVTVRFENAKVKDVLSEIQKITGVNFTYRSHLLKNIKKVTLNATDVQLGDILSQVL